MAVRNRALTIATRGILSAAAVTIATHGLIQIPTGIAPPVEVPVPAQGGGVRAPGERFVLEYPARHEHRTALDIQLYGEGDFGHRHTVPSDYAHRTALDLYLWGDASYGADALYTARSSLTVHIVTGTAAEASYIVDAYAHGALTLDGGHYFRATRPGWHDFAEPGKLALESGTGFEFIPAIDDTPRIIPAVYTYVSDGAVELTGAADIGQRPAPPELFEHSGEGEIDIGGTADAVLLHVDTIEWVEHSFTSSDAITATLDGAATYAATTAQNIDARSGDALRITAYGTAAVTFRHSVDLLPRAYNEDEEILVLFAHMMNDES